MSYGIITPLQQKSALEQDFTGDFTVGSTSDDTMIISGHLQVNGTTTTINSTTIELDDKNIVLANGLGNDAAVDGGGITLASSGGNKTLNWVDSNDAWTSSEHMDLASGKSYMINGAAVISTAALAGSVVGSALTTVGTIGTGVWEATDVAVAHGGTGASSLTDGGVLLGSGTGAITAMAVLADGAMIVGDGTGDPVAESGATLRTSIGVAIGTNVQAYDADLAALAGLTSAADKGIQFTGSGTAAVYTLTAAGKALLDDADAAAQRTTLGLGTAAVTNINALPASTYAAALAMGTNKITGLGAPADDNDAATKAYVDALKQGLSVKDSVRCASTANVADLSVLDNAVGALDGVTVATGDRVLLKDQTSGSENGIYVIAANGAPTRATDFDAAADVANGAFFFVEEGTDAANSGWVLTTDGAITVGTTATTFTQFSGAGAINAGTGLTKVGNTINADASQAQITAIGTITTGEWAATDVAIAHGGTGASTAGAARTAFSVNNTDNTSDANKPVSTAQATAIALKANIAGPTFTGTATAPLLVASTSLALATGAIVTGIDNGALGTSATLLATQGAIKTYVDAQVTASDLDFQGDSGGPLSIDLDSEVLDIAGGTGIATSGAGNELTVAIDATVATLAGTQTLTNKRVDSFTMRDAGDNADYTISGGALAANAVVTMPGMAGQLMLMPVVTTLATGVAPDPGAAQVWICAKSSAGAASSDLPTAASVGSGAMLMFKMAGDVDATNYVQFDRAGTDTIDGATSLAISSPYASVTLLSDGSNWHII